MLESSVVAEWMAEGEAKGMVRAKRDDLLRVLQIRFSLPLPADLEAAIQAQTELESLSHWFDASLKVASLDEFRAAVQR
jgi:hypothetical protein